MSPMSVNTTINYVVNGLTYRVYDFGFNGDSLNSSNISPVSQAGGVAELILNATRVSAT